MTWNEGIYRLLGYSPGAVVPHADMILARVFHDDRGNVLTLLPQVRVRARLEINNESYRVLAAVGRQFAEDCRSRSVSTTATTPVRDEFASFIALCSLARATCTLRS